MNTVSTKIENIRNIAEEQDFTITDLEAAMDSLFTLHTDLDRYLNDLKSTFKVKSLPGDYNICSRLWVIISLYYDRLQELKKQNDDILQNAMKKVS